MIIQIILFYRMVKMPTKHAIFAVCLFCIVGEAVRGQQLDEPECVPPGLALDPSEDFGAAVIYKGGILTPSQPVASPNFGENQEGYALVPYFDRLGQGYFLSLDALPGAPDPNDIQTNSIFGAQPLGPLAPLTPLVLRVPPENVSDPNAAKARVGLQARPGIYFDTGSAGNPFSPQSIDLNPSHKEGQLFFDFSNNLTELPLRGQGDIQSAQFLDLGHSQVYVDAFAPNEKQVAIRSLYARLLTHSRTDAFLVGKGETAFGEVKDIPLTIQGGSFPVGCVSVSQVAGGAVIASGIPQLRYTRYWDQNVYDLTITAEDQRSLNDIDKGNVTLLQRWPAFACHFRYSPTTFDNYQIAGLLRPLAIDDANFVDHAATGWGLAATARLGNSEVLEEITDAVYLGAAWGQGIGGYIYGGTRAAAIVNGTDIVALTNFGAYAAYQHVWYRRDANHNISSYVAYGFVNGEAPTADDNRQLHQGWANLLWNTSKNTAVGFEYQYGSRLVGDGRRGEDNRFMLVFQIGTNSEVSGEADTGYRTSGQEDVRPLSSYGL